MKNPEKRFHYFLARELGMTVNEMLSKMSSNEIVEWMAFYKIESLEQQGNVQQKQMLNELAGLKGRRSKR